MEVRTFCWFIRFEHGAGDSKFSGTHSGIAKTKRKANELRNNLLLYSMYPSFHHKKGTSKAISENKKMVDAKLMSKNRITAKRKKEIERLASRYRAREENARTTESKIEKFWITMMNDDVSLCCCSNT